jgi:transposase-like protein
MSYFTTNLMEILYQGESIDELIRVELEKAVNELLQQDMTALPQYDKYEFSGYGSDNSRNDSYERFIKTRFGEICVVMPRDRNGQFSLVTLSPYQRSTDDLEQMVITFYRQGLVIPSQKEHCSELRSQAFRELRANHSEDREPSIPTSGSQGFRAKGACKGLQN